MSSPKIQTIAHSCPSPEAALQLLLSSISSTPLPLPAPSPFLPSSFPGLHSIGESHSWSQNSKTIYPSPINSVVQLCGPGPSRARVSSELSFSSLCFSLATKGRTLRKRLTRGSQSLHCSAVQLAFLTFTCSPGIHEKAQQLLGLESERKKGHKFPVLFSLSSTGQSLTSYS